MLQKFKVTSYAIIYFLMVGFSFAALQVATVEAQDNTGSCTPKEREDLKATGRYDEHMSLWTTRCADGQTQDVCEHNKWTDWCEWTPVNPSDPQPVIQNTLINEDDKTGQAAELVAEPAMDCNPNARITARHGTEQQADYEYWMERCAKGNEDTCAYEEQGHT